jgi:medium-chain acyl-[acyl-carrier-protein] hydrolase
MKSKWFVVPKPRSSARLRVFCFPYAAGNASTYASWCSQLPDDVELVAVQPPGRASRIEESPYRCMEHMVEGVCEAIEPWLDKPYLLFGHSLGSRVAFEFIHEAMRRRWPQPELFIGSGSAAPHLPRGHKKVSHLPDDEFVKALRRFDGPAEDMLAHPHLRRLFMPMFRADFNIADTYFRNVGERLECRAVIFGGDRDADARLDELEGWQAHFSRPIGIDLFEGDHFFLEHNSERVVARVGQLASRH